MNWAQPGLQKHTEIQTVFQHLLVKWHRVSSSFVNLMVLITANILYLMLFFSNAWLTFITIFIEGLVFFSLEGEYHI